MGTLPADGLTAGEGEEALRQALVQDFLWYRLPVKYPEGSWLPIVRSAEAVLEELGLRRYASIAASETTTIVLEAWREDGARGVARYRAAAEASGVKPPDTELLEWGSVMGLDETSAHARLEVELEDAIVTGALVPGSSGWRSHAALLTEHALRTRAPHRHGRSWHQVILAERLKTWVATGYPDVLRGWRAERADGLWTSSDPPVCLDGRRSSARTP